VVRDSGPYGENLQICTTVTPKLRTAFGTKIRIIFFTSGRSSDAPKFTPIARTMACASAREIQRFARISLSRFFLPLASMSNGRPQSYERRPRIAFRRSPLLKFSSPRKTYQVQGRIGPGVFAFIIHYFDFFYRCAYTDVELARHNNTTRQSMQIYSTMCFLETPIIENSWEGSFFVKADVSGPYLYLKILYLPPCGFY
jgi:hypothetical protein